MFSVFIAGENTEGSSGACRAYHAFSLFSKVLYYQCDSNLYMSFSSKKFQPKSVIRASESKEDGRRKGEISLMTPKQRK